MISIVIGGNSYDSYSSVDDANEYLLPTAFNSTWDVLTDDQKGGNLIQSTRWLDSLSWKADYDTQAEREVVQNILNVSMEAAGLLSTGESAFLGLSVQGAGEKRIAAGSVEIENFRDLTTIDGATQFSSLPINLLNKLKPYLELGTSIGGVFSSGTSADSLTRNSWGFVD